MEQKAFYQALIDINIDPSKTKKCLDDKRPTYAEKRILESYLLIRNNQNKEALDMMRSLAPTGLPFVEAQKDLLIGLSLNNQSMFLDAEASILKAIPVFIYLRSDYFLFMSYFNLSLIYLNTSRFNKMKASIDFMSNLKLETDLQRLRLLRCKFAYFAETDEKEKAEEILLELEAYKLSMPESDCISQLLCEFRFYVRHENFSRCESILNEMKKYRKFNLTENFNFMKKLLGHLTQNTPLYAYQDGFESVPLLKHQISVIRFLEEQDYDASKNHWRELQKIDPEVYLDDFKYTGVKCLFSLCLDKHLLKKMPDKVEKIEAKSQLEALINLLLHSEKPLPKGYIFEILWGSPPQDKEDLKKLTRLVYRARIEKETEITSRKGTYFIERKVRKVKVS